MLFAFSTASSGVRKDRIDSTGPKISSWAIRCDWATLVNSVGLKKNPRSGRTQSGWNISAPSSRPDSTSSLIFSNCARLLIAPTSVFLSIGSPDPQGGEAPLQLVDEPVVDALLDEEPAPGAADVALVEEDPVDNPFDRLVERGIVEDDMGCLSPELQGQLLVTSGELALDQLPHRSGPGEGDLVDVGMARPPQRRSLPRR